MDDAYSNISVEQLRQYMARRNDNDYLLVDVRQQDEYTAGHIPGAILIPVGEIPARMHELPVDKDIVFYCRSGKRSQGAALFAGSSPFINGTVFNMTGGILAWEGHLLPDAPRLNVFDFSGTDRQILVQAMNLERGAERFYTALRQRYKAIPWASSLASLAGAEEAHARLIYQFWSEGQMGPPSFEETYAGLEGDILEGGVSWPTLVTALERQPMEPCRATLEMALLIEYAAYDLYRNLAHRFRGESMAEVFNTIAEAEKEHMRFVAKALALCGE